MFHDSQLGPSGLSMYKEEESDDPEDYIDSQNIEGIQLASVKHLGPYKVIAKSRLQSQQLFRDKNLGEPSQATLEKIYTFYCLQVHAVPVRFLHCYKNGFLNLSNFTLQTNICTAIACVIPVSTKNNPISLSLFL
jgi:hypothetical protein